MNLHGLENYLNIQNSPFKISLINSPVNLNSTDGMIFLARERIFLSLQLCKLNVSLEGTKHFFLQNKSTVFLQSPNGNFLGE